VKIFRVQVPGFGPGLKAWKALVLTRLHYTCPRTVSH
jgi:hypothetical protein